MGKKNRQVALYHPPADDYRSAAELDLYPDSQPNALERLGLVDKNWATTPVATSRNEYTGDVVEHTPASLALNNRHWMERSQLLSPDHHHSERITARRKSLVNERFRPDGTVSERNTYTEETISTERFW